MTEHLSIPRAELEALLSKLENSQLDYAERVGRAQGYIDRWLIMAPKAEGPRCTNCGKEVPDDPRSPEGLCPTCYYNCSCIHHAGDRARCPIHGQKPAGAAEHAAAADAALTEAITQRLVTR